MLVPLESDFNIFTKLILSLAIILFCVYTYFKYSYSYWGRKGVPYLTPTFPLGNNPTLGLNALTYGLESQGWYEAFKKMGVRFGGVWNFYHKALVLVDPGLIKDVMIKDFETFINRDFYHNPHGDPRSENLFVTEDEEWRYMRQKMSPAFTSAKMRYMFECAVKCSEHLVKLFEKPANSNDDIVLRLLIDKYTMDNIGVVAFGLKFDCLITDTNAFRLAADQTAKPNFYNKFKRLGARAVPGLCQRFGMSLLDNNIINFFANLITDNVEQRKKSGDNRNDFTQLMMDIQEASRNDKTRFTMDDLIANCIIFFFAGFDTSSQTMQYSLLELAKNQKLQQKARNEIKKVLETYNGELTYEGLQEMVYLRQVVDETLRLYPPVLTITRICQRKYKLNKSDTILEKGTTVIIPVFGLHRDPDLFPEPEKYDPDRFSPSNKSNILPCTYLPFGDGPRNCIGRRLGLMQSMIGLVRILGNYNIDLSPKLTFPLHIKHGEFILRTEELYVRASKLSERAA